MPKISVIIPNYNHARFLRRRMDTVLGQTFQDFEVILLDDCSTDESRTILGEYVAADPRISAAFNDRNSGSTFKQWNKGVRAAQGEYVWIAESDDYADPRLLERLVDVLDAEPEAVFAYCRSWRVAPDDVLNGFADSYLEYLNTPRWTADHVAFGHDECVNYLAFLNTIPNASAVVFRKSAYERAGGADESLRMCGDWKLWAAMALMGKIVYVGEPLNYFRFHDQSVRTRLSSVSMDETLRVIGWLLPRISPNQIERARIYEYFFGIWISLVTNRASPITQRLAVLRQAMRVDPHALRRLLYFIFPLQSLMEATVPIRSALGLRRSSDR